MSLQGLLMRGLVLLNSDSQDKLRWKYKTHHTAPFYHFHDDIFKVLKKETPEYHWPGNCIQFQECIAHFFQTILLEEEEGLKTLKRTGRANDVLAWKLSSTKYGISTWNKSLLRLANLQQ